jgi:hypothetical protein
MQPQTAQDIWFDFLVLQNAGCRFVPEVSWSCRLVLHVDLLCMRPSGLPQSLDLGSAGAAADALSKSGDMAGVLKLVTLVNAFRKTCTGRRRSSCCSGHLLAKPEDQGDKTLPSSTSEAKPKHLLFMLSAKEP